MPPSRPLLPALAAVLASSLSLRSGEPEADGRKREADGRKREATVTVEARPTPVDANNPSPAEGLDKAQLRTLNVVNTEDSVKYLPNVLVRKRFVGDRNGVLSGRNSNSIQSAAALVYSDGLLLSNFLGNNYNFGPRWGTVAPEEIERVDLIYGPFSALYPGNSMGVTAWITTREPEKLEASARLQGFAQTYADPYGYARTFRGFQASSWMGDRIGSFSYSVGLNHLDNIGQPMQYAVPAATPLPGPAKAVTGARSDLDPTNAPRLILGPTNVEHTVQDQAKVRLGWLVTPGVHLSLSVARWENGYRRQGESFLRDATGATVTSGNILVDGRTYTVPVSAFAPSRGEEGTTLVGLTLKTKLSPDWLVETILSTYQIDRDRLRTSTSASPGRGGQAAFQEGTSWRTADVKATGAAGGDHALAFGLHWDHYRLRNAVFAMPDWTGDALGALVNRFRGQTETLAAYGQDAWSLGPRWSLTLGLRLERWEAHDGFLQGATTSGAFPGRTVSAASPKLSAAWRPDEAWTLRLSLGRATRFPTVSELFQGSLTPSGIVNNDPGLKPERVFAKDLTAERAQAWGLLRVSVFEDEIRDRILRQTNISVTPSITNLQNVDRSRVRGIEASVQWTSLLPGLDLYASASLVQALTLRDAQFPAYEGKRMTTVPRDRATLVANWHPSETWSFALAARRSGDQYSNPDNSDLNHHTYGAASSYTILDAKASLRLRPGLWASLAVDNLGSARAYIYHPYPHRTFTAELRWSL